MRIALYQGISLISRAIRWQTRSQYSHAALLLDDGSVIEAWQPEVRHVLPCAPGGTVDSLSSLSEQHTPGTVVDIFEFNCALSEEENLRLEYFAKQDIGIPYDYRGVSRFVTRFGNGPKRGHLFCSEQVFWRCKQIGRPLLDRTEAWRVPPDWIARSPHLNLTKTITTKETHAIG
jgi:hypothetical protein